MEEIKEANPEIVEEGGLDVFGVAFAADGPPALVNTLVQIPFCIYLDISLARGNKVESRWKAYKRKSVGSTDHLPSPGMEAFDKLAG